MTSMLSPCSNPCMLGVLSPYPTSEGDRLDRTGGQLRPVASGHLIWPGPPLETSRNGRAFLLAVRLRPGSAAKLHWNIRCFIRNNRTPRCYSIKGGIGIPAVVSIGEPPVFPTTKSIVIRPAIRGAASLQWNGIRERYPLVGSPPPMSQTRRFDAKCVQIALSPGSGDWWTRYQRRKV